MEHDIHLYLQGILEGTPGETKNIQIDNATKFYILGLSPNQGRVSIRFFYSNYFGSFVENVAKHYHAMQIIREWETDFKYIPIWKMLSETVSPKSSDKMPPPLLSGAIFRSIIEGKTLPANLFTAILIRIKTDKNINYTRASIIKAYLIRNKKTREGKEFLTMSLNNETANIAYLLGRLFALFEIAQELANKKTFSKAGEKGKINTTIKDRFFSAACSTPAIVFPQILKLGQTHLDKLGSIHLERLIQDVIGKIEDAFLPRYLTLEQQGVFVIGYYHQKKDFYTSKESGKEFSDESN